VLKVELRLIREGYDRKTCWVHARSGFFPKTDWGIITMQKLRLNSSDIFSELNDMLSLDGGRTWSEPQAHTDSLARWPLPGGMEEGICDFTPMWHAASGAMLGTGSTIIYKDDEQIPNPKPRFTGYSVYQPERRQWSPWRKLQLPELKKYYSTGAGCTQRVDLPDGNILLPVYMPQMHTASGIYQFQSISTVFLCAFDGVNLTFIRQGNDMTLPEGRGCCEPSLVSFQGRYYLTLRNDFTALVAVSDDGLHYSEPIVWRFDDGQELGSYNTQQHWLCCGGRLYLVYTRRGADNDHVLRHRAPLFLAEVDHEHLQVIRRTEQILVPEHGAALGNFGVTSVSKDESWVVVSEWMQTTPPNPFDCRNCEKYGSNNRVFLAVVRSSK